MRVTGTVAGESVDVWSLEMVSAIATQAVDAEVVSENEHDVGSLGGRLGLAAHKIAHQGVGRGDAAYRSDKIPSLHQTQSIPLPLNGSLSLVVGLFG